MIRRLISWIGAMDWTTVLVIAAVAAYLMGYGMGRRDANADWTARHAAYVAQEAQARAQAISQNLTALRAEQERGDALSMQLLSSNAERAKLSEDLKKRVPHVSTVYIEKPGAAPVPLPDRPFTVGWVRDYNAALGLRMPQAAAAAGSAARTSAGLHAPGSIGGIDAADLARSAVSQGDVLATHHNNAAVCRKLEAQLNAILDWDEGKTP